MNCRNPKEGDVTNINANDANRNVCKSLIYLDE